MIFDNQIFLGLLQPAVEDGNDDEYKYICNENLPGRVDADSSRTYPVLYPHLRGGWTTDMDLLPFAIITLVLYTSLAVARLVCCVLTPPYPYCLPCCHITSTSFPLNPTDLLHSTRYTSYAYALLLPMWSFSQDPGRLTSSVWIVAAPRSFIKPPSYCI